MGLIPEWSKKVAVLGLELQILRFKMDKGTISAADALVDLSRIERELHSL